MAAVLCGWLSDAMCCVVFKVCRQQGTTIQAYFPHIYWSLGVKLLGIPNAAWLTNVHWAMMCVPLSVFERTVSHYSALDVGFVLIRWVWLSEVIWEPDLSQDWLQMPECH